MLLVSPYRSRYFPLSYNSAQRFLFFARDEEKDFPRTMRRKLEFRFTGTTRWSWSRGTTLQSTLELPISDEIKIPSKIRLKSNPIEISVNVSL